MKPTDALLALGMTARLTRLLTTDDLGQWLIADPARRWANRVEARAHMLGGWWDGAERRDWADDPDPDNGPRSKLVSGLDCPHCVSFHVGYLVLGSYLLVRNRPRLLALWRFGAASLSMSTIVGHLNARID